MRVSLNGCEAEEIAAGAEERIRGLAPLGDEAWIIAQSLTDIRFEKWVDFPLPFDEIFSGRIFAASGEVRWIREGGLTMIWNVREVPGSDFERCQQRYYLWGLYRGGAGRFTEDVVRDLPAYPVLARPKREEDRPYIVVYEYLRQPPARALEPAELMQELNRPRIAAHRFVKFDCGRDEDGA
jgi:hypothetical protein